MICFKSTTVSVCHGGNEQRRGRPAGHHVSSLNIHFDRIIKITAADLSAHCLITLLSELRTKTLVFTLGIITKWLNLY